MVFAYTWNSAFEAAPGDTEDVSLGGSRIRDLKKAISERTVVDHSWAGDANDGKHKKVTLVDQASAPVPGTNEGSLYGFTVSGTTELHYKDESGNITQITRVGAIDVIPSGTKMVFIQNTAPSGWTFDATLNDKVLRVTNTVGNGGTTGGSWTLSGVTVDGHALSEAEIAAHSHFIAVDTVGGSALSASNGMVKQRSSGGDGNYILEGSATAATLGKTSSSGSSNSHTHGLTSDGVWRPAYVDVIVCSKD